MLSHTKLSSLFLLIHTPSPPFTTPLTVNIYPNKLAPDLLNIIPRSSPFCYFALFLIILLIPFINQPDSSRDLTIFMISSISLSEIINAVMPDTKIFF